MIKKTILSLVIASSLVLTGCTASEEGVNVDGNGSSTDAGSTPPPGTTVQKLDEQLLPAIPAEDFASLEAALMQAQSELDELGPLSEAEKEAALGVVEPSLIGPLSEAEKEAALGVVEPSLIGVGMEFLFILLYTTLFVGLGYLGYRLAIKYDKSRTLWAILGFGIPLSLLYFLSSILYQSPSL